MHLVTKILAILLMLLSVMSCKTKIDGKSCLSNDYTKNAKTNKQCHEKYESQQELKNLYEHCKLKTNISDKLNQCIDNTLLQKNQYNNDYNYCSSIAVNKFTNNIANKYTEEQMAITSNWLTTKTLIEFSEPVNDEKANFNSKNFIYECLQIIGWPTPNNWIIPKQVKSSYDIDNQLQQLKNQPVIIPYKSTNEYIVLLHKAAADGNLQNLKNILDKKLANVEDINYQGYTALHFAALNGRIEVAKYLIDVQSANIDVKGKDGRSVIDFAVKSHNSELVNYLTKKQQQRSLIKKFPRKMIQNSLISWVYIGCYQDKEARGFPFAFMQSPYMTNSQCQIHCAQSGFSLAATQFGLQCFCGNNLPNYRKVHDSECGNLCAGNDKEYCGGSWYNSVWQKMGTAYQFKSSSRVANFNPSLNSGKTSK